MLNAGSQGYADSNADMSSIGHSDMLPGSRAKVGVEHRERLLHRKMSRENAGRI